MADCKNCTAHCHDGDCPAGGSLELTRPEVDFLNRIGQYAFVAVARRPDDMIPHAIPDSEEMCLVLQCLEKKNLISIDYGAPLKGFDYDVFPGLRVHGSAGLTERGVRVLELLEIQGIE